MAQNLLEEVIVTAQKREATLSDTPIAITALTSDQMKALGRYRARDKHVGCAGDRWGGVWRAACFLDAAAGLAS